MLPSPSGVSHVVMADTHVTLHLFTLLTVPFVHNPFSPAPAAVSLASSPVVALQQPPDALTQFGGANALVIFQQQ